MTESREQRLARNEAFFREVNEQIRDVAGRQGVDEHVYEFVCECSDAGCVDTVSLTLAEYERVRAKGTRFVLAPGHAVHTIERIVAVRSDHLVVEKVGVAAEPAEALDPRDD